MMKLIRLPNDLDNRCFVFGLRLHDHYGNGGSPNSRAVSSHGMESNSEGLADGQRGECVFALEMGLDPMTALDWRADCPDGGWDVIVGGAKIDVKTTVGGRLLIYPYRKWEAGVFESSPANYFVLVRIVHCADGGTEGCALGWCSKDFFRRKHRMADGTTPKGITAGTPYLDMDELAGMDIFPPMMKRRSA
jgi:hypothetical protein